MDKKTIVKYAREEARNLKNTLSEAQRLRYIRLKDVDGFTSIYELMYSKPGQRTTENLKNSVTKRKVGNLTPLEFLMTQNNSDFAVETNLQICRYLRKNDEELARFRNVEI